MDRGLQLAVLVLCFSMAAGSLGALGLYTDWGVSVNPGEETDPGDIQDEEALIDPTVDTDDGLMESFVDTITPGLGVLTTLADGVRGVTGMLGNLGVPNALAAPVGAVVVIAMSISLAKFVRGVT